MYILFKKIKINILLKKLYNLILCIIANYGSSNFKFLKYGSHRHKVWPPLLYNIIIINSGSIFMLQTVVKNFVFTGLIILIYLI